MKKPDSGDSRTVRVFLSSTFRDFMEERDLLVRKVFPELRRRCRLRQVELVEVDLRWGITEQEAQQGKVLPICLAEIDRARPFFMGLLGERYGWVPEKNQYDLSLIVEQPWLEEHRGGKSVTELEILHGVLNNPAMKNRAFFYLRDPRWAEKRGGAYLGEGPTEKAKLAELKVQIRQSGFPVVENYPNPEALAERVQQDLWKLIDEAYPESEVPDALALERRRHETFGTSHFEFYSRQEHSFKFLNSAITTNPFKPILIIGASGAGKSALIANWIKDYSLGLTKTLNIVHYIGLGGNAGDPVNLVERLIKEIARFTGDEVNLDSNEENILNALPDWLARASSYAEKKRKEWLIIIDGLDKLVSSRDFRWLPAFLPQRVKIVASCQDTNVQNELRSQAEWREFTVSPLAPEDGLKILQDYLRKFNKVLPLYECDLILRHPLATSPLFSRVLAEEMRVFGQHELLRQKLASYLSSTTIPELFSHVLDRIESDNPNNSVCSSLSYIWASRAGLFEEELLTMAGLAPATWATIRNALGEALLESLGRIQFAHDYIKQAVEIRYLFTQDLKKQAHENIAMWFAAQRLTPRVIEELPWQWQNTGNLSRLKSFLLSLENLAVFGESSIPWTEVHRYWISCGGEDQAKEYLSLMQELLDRPPSPKELLGCRVLTNLVSKFRWLHFSITLDRLYLILCARTYGENHSETLKATASLGNHLGEAWTEDAHKEAEELLHSVYEKRLSILGPEDLETIEAESDLGSFLSATRLRNSSTLETSRRLLEEADILRSRLLGPSHHETLITKNNLAILHWRMSRHQDALKLLQNSAQTMESKLGRCHPETLLISNNLAAMLRDYGDLEAAEQIFTTTIRNMDEAFGLTHRDTLNCIQDLGMLLEKRGDHEGAKKMNAEIWKRRGLGTYPS